MWSSEAVLLDLAKRDFLSSNPIALAMGGGTALPTWGGGGGVNHEGREGGESEREREGGEGGRGREGGREGGRERDG